MSCEPEKRYVIYGISFNMYVRGPNTTHSSPDANGRDCFYRVRFLVEIATTVKERGRFTIHSKFVDFITFFNLHLHICQKSTQNGQIIEYLSQR